jgi:enhancing lycopene biosynthesis protein 2
MGLATDTTVGMSSGQRLTVSSTGAYASLFAADTTMDVIEHLADMPWVTVEAGLVSEAAVAGEPGHAAIFTAEQGVQLPGGFAAPARRAGFCMVGMTGTVAAYSPAWYELLASLLVWAANK